MKPSLRSIASTARRVSAVTKLVVHLAVVGGPGVALADGPVVQLNPTVLIQDIRQSRSIADNLQADIQSALAEVERHQARLKTLNCSADDVAGRCKAPRTALRVAYGQLLDRTEAQLPPLKRAVDRITLTLKQRIEANGTPLSLEAQQRLLGDSPRTTHTPRLLGVSGARLSTHLAQLQKLVGGAAGSGMSIDAIAADLYLDMLESSRLIDTLGSAVATSKIRLALQPDEEIALLADDATIADIHAQVFGAVDVAVVPSPPVGGEAGPFVSPLEL